MNQLNKNYFSLPINKYTSILNQWDIILLLFIFSAFILISWFAKQMSIPYEFGKTINITLNPYKLPYYSLMTVMRILISMVFSLLFSVVVALVAVKNKFLEKKIIQTIDILQSIPILGFLPFMLPACVGIFQGSRLGPELASILTIFTAQAWNMTLAFYQGLKTIPADLKEAAKIMQLKGFKKFFKLEAPFAAPLLVWNAMLSMSGSWIFLIASETIDVNNQVVNLPGIGSYLGLAISQGKINPIFYAIIAMFVVILLYDQIILRPLLKWCEKFKIDNEDYFNSKKPLLTLLFQKTKLLKRCYVFLEKFFDLIIKKTAYVTNRARKAIKFQSYYNLRLKKNNFLFDEQFFIFLKKIKHYLRNPIVNKGILTLIVVVTACALYSSIFSSLSYKDLFHVIILAIYTLFRVMASIVLSSIIWVPAGIFIGLKPKLSKIIQPIAQFLAAFPMNVLFPIFVITILKFSLNPEYWTILLITLGSQWYLAFNIIAGASAIPKDIRQIAENFNVKGYVKWKRLLLPAIFPYYITGAITAAGNAWNTSIVAEVVSWKGKIINVNGLGNYIATASVNGNFKEIAIGIMIMGIVVIITNKCVWRPLLNLSHKNNLEI